MRTGALKMLSGLLYREVEWLAKECGRHVVKSSLYLRVQGLRVGCPDAAPVVIRTVVTAAPHDIADMSCAYLRRVATTAYHLVKNLRGDDSRVHAHHLEL
jgi:hypothetical protein